MEKTARGDESSMVFGGRLNYARGWLKLEWASLACRVNCMAPIEDVQGGLTKLEAGAAKWQQGTATRST